MGLTLIIGRANAGKSGAVTRHLAKGVSERCPTVLLLPGHAEARRAREEIASSLPVGVTISTFEAWLEACWSGFGDGRRLISPGLREAFAERLSQEAEGVLLPVAGTPGLSRLLTELAAKTAGFEKASAGTPSSRALSALLTKYEALTAEEGLVEAGEAFRLLAVTEAFSGLTIAFNRFTQLSPAQLRAVRELSVGSQVLVTLTWERGFAATEALTETVDALAEIATQVRRIDTPEPTTELELFEANVLDPSVLMRPEGGVVLSEAAGVEAEAVLIADAVKRALLQGVQPGRIAVTARNIASRRHRIETALHAQGIPHVIDVRTEIAQTSMGGALSALLALAAGRGGRAEALHFLRSPFAAIGAPCVEDMDVKWRRGRVQDGRRLRAESAALSPRIDRLITAAQKALQATVNCGGATDWKSLAALLLDAPVGQGNRRGPQSNSDAAVYSRVVQLASELSAATIGVTGEEFARILMRSSVTGGSTDTLDSVQVTEAHRLRSRRFDVVVVAGLTAAEFSMDDREPLAASVMRELGLSPGVAAPLSERLLFYMITTRARVRLELVRQFADAAGNALRPSVFWEEVLDLYRTPGQASAGENGLLEVSHRVYLSSLDTAAPSFARGRQSLRTAASSRAAESLSRRQAKVDDPTCLWPESNEFSVTELEDYLACPYRWFYGRTIRPHEIDGQFAARERGSYAHAMIAAFYDRWRSSGQQRITPETLPDALRLLEEVSHAAGIDVSHRTRSLTEELSVAAARAWVRRSMEQDAVILHGFEPIACEWEFGHAAGAPFAFGGVQLRGKVDRIDRGTAGIVVMDYKSASEVKGQRGFVPGGLLQAGVYARAAADGLDSELVCSVYRSLPTGRMRGFWNYEREVPDTFVAKNDLVDNAALAALFEATEARVASAVAGIRDGVIHARPACKDSCTYCGAKLFCAEAQS